MLNARGGTLVACRTQLIREGNKSPLLVVEEGRIAGNLQSRGGLRKLASPLEAATREGSMPAPGSTGHRKPRGADLADMPELPKARSGIDPITKNEERVLVGLDIRALGGKRT